jgi:hypothetical protein
MGGSQSKMPETAITEKLTERLRAMQLEHEKDYLMIEKDGKMITSINLDQKPNRTCYSQALIVTFGGYISQRN